MNIGRTFRYLLLGAALVLPLAGRGQSVSDQGDSLRPSVALKTNLLYDALLTPNFEIEKDLGPRLSLAAETAFPWYTWHNNLRCYEVFEAGGELRWWTGHFARMPHRRLTGYFVGLYGAGGYYDLEWDGTGHRGGYWSAGFSLGCSRRIGRRLNLEFQVSCGYVGGSYTSYEADADYHPLERHQGSLGYAGPTKVKLSLVWLIGSRKRHKKIGGQGSGAETTKERREL